MRLDGQIVAGYDKWSTITLHLSQSQSPWSDHALHMGDDPFAHAFSQRYRIWGKVMRIRSNINSGFGHMLINHELVAVGVLQNDVRHAVAFRVRLDEQLDAGGLKAGLDLTDVLEIV